MRKMFVLLYGSGKDINWHGAKLSFLNHIMTFKLFTHFMT